LAFPLLTSLFDRNVFENAVDIFFNMLILVLPLSLVLNSVLYFINAAALKNFILAEIILSIVAFVLIWINPYQTPYANFKEALNAAGPPVLASTVTVFPPYPYSYREIETTQAHPLSPNREHPFGTDEQGRDILARILFGTRISLTIGVLAVSIYIFIGTILGAVAGYFGGRTDLWISRLIEVMICFPAFFVILTIAGFIKDRSIFHIMLIIGLTGWTSPARLVRAEFLRQRGLEYVEAARALGLRQFSIIFHQILPNALAPILVTATFGIASAILTETSLSFLGLGDPTVPSWGEILTTGRVQQKAFLILIPGLAIFFVVSVFNLVGEGLRDALDPKMKM
jgi:peptide/nickel transport system permease protein